MPGARADKILARNGGERVHDALIVDANRRGDETREKLTGSGDVATRWAPRR